MTAINLVRDCYGPSQFTGRWYALMCAVLSALLTALTLVGAPQPTLAQGLSLAVVPGVANGVTEQEWADIVEESAFLVEDFGLYTVNRYYEMEATVGTDLAVSVLACGPDSQCVADMLYGSIYAFALHVNLERTEWDVRVTYRLVDVASGSVSGEATAVLVAPTDFPALQTPCWAALRGERLAAPAVATGPVAPQQPVGPVGQQPASWPADQNGGTSPPDLSRPAPPRASVGPIGRAGRITAAAGAALAAGGVLLSFAADDTLQTIQSEPHPRGELESLQQQGRNQQRMGNVLMITGGVALATGITLVIVDRPERSASVSLRVTPDGRFAIGGRF
jgi:hypothetical protein